MIDISVNENGELQIGQRLSSPAVYMDHWALLDFSEDENLGLEFMTTLQAREGTLTLSWLNLVEFSKVTNREQARKAELFIEKNLPRIFFIEVEPFQVIRSENSLLAGGPKLPPQADPSLLQKLLSLAPASSQMVYPLSVHNLFSSVQDEGLAGDSERFADTVIERIETMREEVRHESDFESAVRRLPSGPTIQAGTRYVIRELLRTMLLNKQMKITRNHAIDLLHAVVPVSYCDFVLLDRNWETQVAQMRKRVSDARMSFPIAKVFSRKGSGLERFLKELETT